ncbi:MAG: hypothetical protein SGARI_003624, partial [Bacillariaceae sp.]
MSFLVRRFYDPSQLAASDDPVTRYVRTRKVKFEQASNGKYCIVCDCGYFRRTQGIPCRHIYCCWPVEPETEHCGARHLITFDAFYEKEGHEKFTELIDESFAEDLPGPMVEPGPFLPNCFSRYEDEESKQWVLEPLQRVIPVSDTLQSKKELERLRKIRDAYEEGGFAFMSNPLGEDDEDHDGPALPDDNARIGNGYRAICSLPVFQDVSQLVVKGKHLKIVNESLENLMGDLLISHGDDPEVRQSIDNATV